MWRIVRRAVVRVSGGLVVSAKAYFSGLDPMAVTGGCTYGVRCGSIDAPDWIAAGSCVNLWPWAASEDCCGSVVASGGFAINAEVEA